MAYTWKDRRDQSNVSVKVDGVPVEIKIFKCLDYNCERVVVLMLNEVPFSKTYGGGTLLNPLFLNVGVRSK